MEKGRIICGFAGIGKSTVAKEYNWVDLESTPFKKNWDMYSDVAIHMANNGYNVMLSCHREIRDALIAKKQEYTIVIPDPSDKELYLKRYKARGNTKEFIKLFDNKWYEFITEILEAYINNFKYLDVYTLKSGEYLEDYLFPKHNDKE